MSKEQRIGKRRPRSFECRSPKLGYYIIYTDTQETEENYIEGFKKSLPIEFQEKIEIQILKDKTANLVKRCCEYMRNNPQYRSAWIIFDKDQVSKFDEIIEEANSKNIQVAWSNPCIEIWFSGYLGKISCIDSMTCCRNFSILYKQKTGKEYDKGEKEIYQILNKTGNEQKAIKYFKQKYENAHKDKLSPGEQLSGSYMFALVEEIRNMLK